MTLPECRSALAKPSQHRPHWLNPAGITSPALVTHLKRSTMRAAMKKVNSTPARPGTLPAALAGPLAAQDEGSTPRQVPATGATGQGSGWGLPRALTVLEAAVPQCPHDSPAMDDGVLVLREGQQPLHRAPAGEEPSHRAGETHTHHPPSPAPGTAVPYRERSRSPRRPSGSWLRLQSSGPSWEGGRG